MTETKDLLWKLYEQQVQQIRHFQEERRSIANTVLLIAGALVALIGYDQKLNRADYELGLFLVVLGIFGVMCMAKCHERISHYQRKRDVYQARLDSLVARDFIKTADEEAKAGRGWWWGKFWNRIYLYYLWTLMFVLIALLGYYVMTRPESPEPRRQGNAPEASPTPGGADSGPPAGRP